MARKNTKKTNKTKAKSKAKAKGKSKAKAKTKSKARVYQHPIPSRTELLDYLEKTGTPVNADKMLADLGLKGQRMRGMLVDRLYKMVRAGQVIENRRGEFCLTAK